MFSGVFDFLKVGAYNYCQLESVKDETTFIKSDGGYLTVIEILGTNKITSHKALLDKHEFLIEKLKGNMVNAGHRLQFVFSRDPIGAKREIRESLAGVYNTMKSLKLDFGAMIKEREDVLGKNTASERCYLIVSTNRDKMPAQVSKKANKDRVKRAEGSGIKPGKYLQSPFMDYVELYTSHDGFVKNICNIFDQSGLMLNVLKVHDALKAVRMEICPDMTSENWRPHLFGDKSPFRMTKEDIGVDFSHLGHPNIGFQLFSEEPEHPIYEGYTDRTMVKMGSKIYAPLCVDIGPQDPKPFNDLFNNIPSDIPWRFSLTIDTGSEQVKSKLGSRKGFATFLKFTNSNNGMIMEGCNELIDLCNEGVVLVTANMSFCTWAENAHDARKNKAMLTQSIQSWGYIEVIEERGDSIEAWLNTIPAISSNHISNKLPMTLDEAMFMSPFSRPASPWKKGSMLYRTIDNKLFQYLPGSSMQSTWVDLVFAPPGYGKSFFLAASNMSLILAPGNKSLPRISIIDIGFSSGNFVQLVKQALPENKRHLAESFKIEMNPDLFMVNPFDTPLGCNHPLAIDREWLVSFMTVLLTPASEKEGVPRLGDIMGLLVDAMYEYYDTDSYPKIYYKHMNEDVDKAIIDYDLNVTEEKTTWYEIRDMLFKKGAYYHAGLAQRYGVPNLNDATEVLSNRKDIEDQYHDALYKNEPLLGYISSSLISSIRAYPILSGPSIFDTGSARIISMDLSAVAKRGSDESDKKTGVMYMLARQIMCKEFYRDEDTLIEIPNLYKKYHEKIIQDEGLTPKKICMDEFHRTEGSTRVRQQVVTDIREGRKFDIHVSLLSQSIDDFDSNMIEFATNVYILSKGMTEDVIDKINNKFKPTEDAIRALKMYVNGPVPGEGSTMLYLGTLKGRRDPKVEHPIRLTLGPIEMWAYSTTHEDVIIRKKLAKIFGLSKSLSILAKEFPSGVKNYIEIKKGQDIGNSYDTENEENSIYDDICLDIIKKYQ